MRSLLSILSGALIAASCVALSGCGTTIKRDATDQLLASDAVDRSVRHIDFRSLAGQKIFFDTTYIKPIVAVGFVNSDYIISSLRQQMVAADCRLQATREEADFIVEARVGALGADRHEVVWGIPSNNLIGTVASAVPDTPAPPSIPEIALAKKSDEKAIAKIGVFAYHRETGQPIWQSGINQSKSTARNTSVFGIGPFQSGTIHEGTEFAGSKIGLPLIGSKQEQSDEPVVPYEQEVLFNKADKALMIADGEKPAENPAEAGTPEPQPEVKQVGGEKPAEGTLAPAESPENGAPAGAGSSETETNDPQLLPPGGGPQPQAKASTDKSPRPTTKAMLIKPRLPGWNPRVSDPE